MERFKNYLIITNENGQIDNTKMVQDFNKLDKILNLTTDNFFVPKDFFKEEIKQIFGDFDLNSCTFQLIALYDILLEKGKTFFNNNLNIQRAIKQDELIYNKVKNLEDFEDLMNIKKNKLKIYFLQTIPSKYKKQNYKELLDNQKEIILKGYLSIEEFIKEKMGFYNPSYYFVKKETSNTIQYVFESIREIPIGFLEKMNSEIKDKNINLIFATTFTKNEKYISKEFLLDGNKIFLYKETKKRTA